MSDSPRYSLEAPGLAVSVSPLGLKLVIGLHVNKSVTYDVAYKYVRQTDTQTNDVGIVTSCDKDY